MATYILRRVLISLPIILGITVIVFMLANMMPGDAVLAMISSDTPLEADLIKLRQGQLGLDLPLHEQTGAGWATCCRATWATLSRPASKSSR